MTQDSLEDLFNEIRRTYFPRWDRKGHWSVRLGAPPNWPRLGGFCDFDEHTIWIADPRTSAPPRAVVIHEVTHAVVGANVGHGRRFQQRLLKAADVAGVQGDDALAAELRQEAAEWAGPRYRPRVAYKEIRDHAFECDDYDVLLRGLAEEHDLLPEEFKRRYKRARTVFEEARKDAALEAELQARVLGLE